MTFFGNLVAGNGVENDTTLTVSAGQTITANGAGLDNFGTLVLNGGTLAGSGPLVNDYAASFSGHGTINGAFTNLSSTTVSGVLNVNGTFNNAGVITVAALDAIRMGPPNSFNNTGVLNLNGGSFSEGAGITNAAGGVINLIGGALSGGGTVTNAIGGTIQGYGTIAGPVSNGGLIWANGTLPLNVASISGAPGNVGGELRVSDSATLNVIANFTSAGAIVLHGVNAQLTGGSVTNSGTISGIGRVSNTVVNSGVIRAEGGQLTIAGASNSNAVGAQIQVAAGNTVFYTQGLTSNSGTIGLTGGAFDNNNVAMLNFGNIEGNGIVRTGGLTNAGTMLFTDAATSVFGAVTNNGGAAPGTIKIVSNTTTFFGPVTNNGTIKVTGGVARFLGNGVSMTVGGTYNSDPSDNYFSGLAVTSGGNVLGGNGDRFSSPEARL